LSLLEGERQKWLPLWAIRPLLEPLPLQMGVRQQEKLSQAELQKS
jgi:hypothetical protein